MGRCALDRSQSTQGAPLTEASAPTTPDVVYSVKAHKHDGLLAKSTIILDCSRLPSIPPEDSPSKEEKSHQLEDVRDASLLAFAHVIISALGKESVFEAHVYPEVRTIEIVIPQFLVEDVPGRIARYCAFLGHSFGL